MIDTNKSIEDLENDYWGDPTYGSYVVTTCHTARQKTTIEASLLRPCLKVAMMLNWRSFVNKSQEKRCEK